MFVREEKGKKEKEKGKEKGTGKKKGQERKRDRKEKGTFYFMAKTMMSRCPFFP
jgi:hypothetical protein